MTLTPLKTDPSEALSADICQNIERLPNQQVRCTRIANQHYRCNWWSRDVPRLGDGRGPWLLVTTHRVDRSELLRVGRGTERLTIEIVSDRRLPR